MRITLGMTEVCAQSAPNFSTSFFRFNVAASLIAYTVQKKCVNCLYNYNFKNTYSKY